MVSAMDHRQGLEPRAETILVAHLLSGSRRRPAQLPEGRVRAVQAGGDSQGILRPGLPRWCFPAFVAEFARIRIDWLIVRILANSATGLDSRNFTPRKPCALRLVNNSSRDREGAVIVNDLQPLPDGRGSIHSPVLSSATPHANPTSLQFTGRSDEVSERR